MNFIGLFSFLTCIVTTAAGFWESWGCPTGPKGDEDLQVTMENKLFGQHIVLKTVPNVIKKHLETDNPKKALVISFHGTTGIGKSYVTEMIARYIYGKEGLRSKFVHTFDEVDFVDPRKVNEYRTILNDTVVHHTQLCERSLFVFFEVERMQHGIFDVLKPYLDYRDNVRRINYRKNIFIFQSNIGGLKIKEFTLHNINSGGTREDIPSNKLEEILSRESVATGGFEKTLLILQGLVDFFVPFLPLEIFHIKQCILEELSHHYNCGGRFIEIMEKVADEVQYETPGNKSLALNGCKMLDKKIHMIS